MSMRMKSLVQNMFGRVGYQIQALEPLKTYVPGILHSTVYVQATYSPWLNDAEFQSTHAAIATHTLVDKYRCYELWQLVAETAKLTAGDILEVGVYRGGTGCLIAARSARLGLSASVFLCDTFKGVVKAGPRDPCYRGHEHSDTSKRDVLELAGKLDLQNVQLLEGIFPEDTGQAIEDRRFRLCHIDVDVYQSAKDIDEWMWDRLALGGVVVYDDYGFNGTEGITQFVNEQRRKRDRIIVQNLNGHAVIIKVG